MESPNFTKSRQFLKCVVPCENVPNYIPLSLAPPIVLSRPSLAPASRNPLIVQRNSSRSLWNEQLLPVCQFLPSLEEGLGVFFYFTSTLTLSSSFTLGIANASIALRSLNQDLPTCSVRIADDVDALLWSSQFAAIEIIPTPLDPGEGLGEDLILYHSSSQMLLLLWPFMRAWSVVTGASV